MPCQQSDILRKIGQIQLLECLLQVRTIQLRTVGSLENGDIENGADARPRSIVVLGHVDDEIDVLLFEREVAGVAAFFRQDALPDVLIIRRMGAVLRDETGVHLDNLIGRLEVLGVVRRGQLFVHLVAVGSHEAKGVFLPLGGNEKIDVAHLPKLGLRIRTSKERPFQKEVRNLFGIHQRSQMLDLPRLIHGLHRRLQEPLGKLRVLLQSLHFVELPDPIENEQEDVMPNGKMKDRKPIPVLRQRRRLFVRKDRSQEAEEIIMIACHHMMLPPGAFFLAEVIFDRRIEVDEPKIDRSGFQRPCPNRAVNAVEHVAVGQVLAFSGVFGGDGNDLLSMNAFFEVRLMVAAHGIGAVLLDLDNAM